MIHSNINVIRSSSRKFYVSLLVAFMLSLAAVGGAQAQTTTALIHHKVQKLKTNPPELGRDFWTSMMSNYWGVNIGDKYIRLYITSPQNTTAYVSAQGVTYPIPIVAYKTSSFLVPEFWEMESSGVIEDKAIHIWSNDADLTVYDMSHNDYTTDGSYIIPTIGWGTDYVVAAYGSLFEGGGSYVYDLPSTLAITADEDNTTVTIIPTCDCRMCTSGNDAGDANSTIVMFPQGVPFQETLNRGQDMQLMPVKATGPDGYDLTGTIIHANQPVGVRGGSVCPNIPDDFPYCDHVEEDCPPTRTWAETYMGTSFAEPPGSSDHDWGMYLLISSQPGQTIYVHSCLQGDRVAAVISNKYGIVWDEEEAGEKYYSNAPFECFEYINSATYPDKINGDGDPAEASVNPREDFTKTVVFQTPTSGNPYTNYANITINNADIDNTTFDGQKTSAIPHQCIDNNWSICVINNIAEGCHVVTGDDSGVGVYVYGYGFDESYAWTGGFGNATFNSPDTVPPTVDTIGECFNAFVHVADSGLLPDKVDTQSGLGQIRVDSDANMTYIPDNNPAFQEGSGADTAGYGMYVTDPSQPAALVVDVYDVAGNETIITSTYQPLNDSIRPPLNNLGIWTAGNPPNIGYDTIFNNGKVPATITILGLKYGNVGFSIFDSVGGPVDMSPLAPGQFRRIMIKFTAQKPTVAVDSILFGNECNPQSVAVIGSGGGADFVVSNQSWIDESLPPPAGGYQKSVTITNLATIPIKIDSAWWPDQVHFQVAMVNGVAGDTVPGDSFPISLTPQGTAGGTHQFIIAYYPTNSSITTPDITHGNWTSPQVLTNGTSGSEIVKVDSLYGSAVAPSTIFGDDTVIGDTCAPGGSTAYALLTISATGNTNSTISHISQSDSASGDFKALVTTFVSSNNTWPSDSEVNLPKGQSATVLVTYNIPLNADTVVYDSISAYDGDGNLIGGRPIVVEFVAVYRSYNVPSNVDVGTALFQSPAIQTSYFIQNTGGAPLAIDTVKAQGLYLGAYTIQTTPPWPDTLAVGAQMQVTIQFNPGFSFDSTQPIQIGYVTNSCNSIETQVTSEDTVDGALVTTFTPTPILSCGTITNNVTVSNNKPKNVPANPNMVLNDIVDHVVNFGWTSGGGSNMSADGYFSYAGIAVGDTIDGTVPGNSPTTVTIPVTFTPPQIPIGQYNTYIDTLTVQLHSNDNTDTTMTIIVKGIAGSVGFSTNSTIATAVTGGSSEATASSTMYLPANVTTTGFNAPSPFTVDQLGITQVKLTYVIPNSDLLTLNTGWQTGGFQCNVPGWTAKPPVQSLASPTGPNTITVVLTGPALTGNVTSFGNFQFSVDLNKTGDETPVTLSSVEFDTGSAESAINSSCVGSAVQSGTFTLQLECGDSTLRAVMNGGANLSFIGPASPDPVTGSDVTFKYANLSQTNLTLSIYDELGHEVMRPLDNVSQEAGAWQLTSNVSQLPSGNYTYRLSGSNAATGVRVVSGEFVVQR